MPNIAKNFRAFITSLDDILSASPIPSSQTDEIEFISDFTSKIKKIADEQVDDFRIPYHDLFKLISLCEKMSHEGVRSYATENIIPFCSAECKTRRSMLTSVVKLIYNCKIVTDTSMLQIPLDLVPLCQSLFSVDNAIRFICQTPFQELARLIQHSQLFASNQLHLELTHMQTLLEVKWNELATARLCTTPKRFTNEDTRLALTPEMQQRFVLLSKFGKIPGASSAPTSPTAKQILPPKASSAPTTPKDADVTSDRLCELLSQVSLQEESPTASSVPVPVVPVISIVPLLHLQTASNNTSEPPLRRNSKDAKESRKNRKLQKKPL